MRQTVRLTWPLVLVLTILCGGFALNQARLQSSALRTEVERRSELTARSVGAALEPLLEPASPPAIQGFVDRLQKSARNARVAVYNASGELLAADAAARADLAKLPATAAVAMAQDRGRGDFTYVNGVRVHEFALPLHVRGKQAGALIVVYDASWVQSATLRIWRNAGFRILLQLLALAFAAALVVRLRIEQPIAKTTRWLRAMRNGASAAASAAPADDLWGPFAQEVTQFATSLNAARAAADREAKLRHAADSLWTRERLAALVRDTLQDSRFVVVSNREPYMHRWKGREVEMIVPASGLVTALEPILNASGGTWVAHGSGDADRTTVDAHSRLQVPPERPQYTLRRVWLGKEEEQGYYYGFANEGFWPLCHVAHTRPIFRASDWEHYRSVNAKFADAVADEIRGVHRPIVFVQDYHFALLPRMIKQRRPDARVAVFWHIPWPNPEAFSICPWQSELLDGMLGADLIGFHVQTHCHNFLQTVDRALECRIEWTSQTAVRKGHRSIVKPFPISVDYDRMAQPPDGERTYLTRQPEVLAKLGIEALFLGVGVDRVDYTKGIPERFLAIERFLDKFPSYQGKFTFVQIAAPSRTQIPSYLELMNRVRAEAERINARFQTGKWKPIVFLNRHHTHAEIEPYYKTADVCLVTALHDGMNLVAKEFLAARTDREGMLVLSRFAGAAQELQDALVVNPYDLDEVANAIRDALEMNPEERRARMQRMQKTIHDHNIFRWAGMVISEVTGLREEERRPPDAAVAPASIAARA